jgi:hypothetical protein
MMTNTTAATARQKLTTRIASLDTVEIVALVARVGGGDVTDAERVLRTHLLAEFERREGGEAVDVLMDSIGL